VVPTSYSANNVAARAHRRFHAACALLLAFLLWPVAAHAAFVPKSYFLYNFTCSPFPGTPVPTPDEACSCGGLPGGIGLCNDDVNGSSTVNLIPGTPQVLCNVSQYQGGFCRRTTTNRQTGGVSVSDPGFEIGRNLVNTCPPNSTPNPDGSCSCTSTFLQTIN